MSHDVGALRTDVQSEVAAEVGSYTFRRIAGEYVALPDLRTFALYNAGVKRFASRFW